MNAAPLITSGTGLYKAVCHKCQYVGFEPNSTKCPTCGFPLLLEPYGSDGLTLRDIFDRSTIEIKGCNQPSILPGVNRSARQRKEMLERAQKRLSNVHESQPESQPQLLDRTGTTEHYVPTQSSTIPTSMPAPSHDAWTSSMAMSTMTPGTSHTDQTPAPSYYGDAATFYNEATVTIGRGRSYWPMFVAFLLFATTAMAAASSGF